MPTNAIPFISVEAAAVRWADRPAGVVLLDVREPFEWKLAAVEASTNISLRSVPQHLDQLIEASEVLCLCHHGIRSQTAAAWLIGQGVKAVNVQGGIDAWSIKVDPSIPRY